MATAEQIPGSILSTVVQHEKSLLTQLEDAREAARAAVDNARAEARTILQKEESKLADESAQMRRAAEADRNEAFNRIVQEAEQQLVGVREAAHARVPAVTEKVLALFVPGSPGDSRS